MSISKVLLRVAVVAYAISLVLPTVEDGRGLIFAVWGFVTFAMARVWAVVWLANPAFVAAAWMTHAGRHPVLRRILALAALAFAVYAITIDPHQGAHEHAALQTGYWVWVASIALLFVSTLLSPSHESEGGPVVISGEARA